MGPLAPFKLDVFPSMGIHAHGCDLCMNVMIVGLSLKGQFSVIVSLRVRAPCQMELGPLDFELVSPKTQAEWPQKQPQVCIIIRVGWGPFCPKARRPRYQGHSIKL
jgi:hypothetical protein